MMGAQREDILHPAFQVERAFRHCRAGKLADFFLCQPAGLEFIPFRAGACAAEVGGPAERRSGEVNDKFAAVLNNRVGIPFGAD